MTEPNLYVVRRCDGFYRFWHDVAAPAPIAQARSLYDQLTGGGAHSFSSDHVDYFDIFPAAPPPRWTSGSVPLIRRLRRADAAMLNEHFLALDQEDRRLRFCRNIADTQIRGYAEGIDWDRSFLLGALHEDRLIGLSEAFFDRPFAPRHAEIAVTVSRPMRGQGLGRHLIDLALDYISVLGVTQTSLFFLQENRAIQRIVRALGGALDVNEPAGSIPGRAGAPVALTA